MVFFLINYILEKRYNSTTCDILIFRPDIKVNIYALLIFILIKNKILINY